MALLLVRGPVRPELFLAAGTVIIVAVVVYLLWPRVGAIVLMAAGATVCAACIVGLMYIGTLPWLLTGFWGGSAALLAGLLDLIGRDTSDPTVSATVVAVVSLLLLSALGLGAYVRMTWSESARVMLESVPTDVGNLPGARLGDSGSTVEPAAGGRWQCSWTVRTRDLRRSWQSLRLSVESAGWAVADTAERSPMTAEKDGYELQITVTPADALQKSPSGGPVEFTASVGER
jgi:hypothetical protein